MESAPLVQIDIAKVIKTKNKQLYRWLPSPVIRYLKHIIHQDEINDILQRSHLKYYDTEFADFLVNDFQVSYQLHHAERIPQDGKLIVVSNHPLGGFDGILLISILAKYRQNIKFPVNDLLMHIPNFQNIFVPVNKTGKNHISLAASFERIFSGDNTILYFPAGICSRKIKGQITDLEWKKTFVSKAKQFGHDILPVYFDGRNSNFFYNLANIRKKLGIRSNIEMLYLADEFFRQRRSHFNITVGNVIKNARLFDRQNDFLTAQEIKKSVYALSLQ
ncbi:MAG: 1-acyl-sn-glycerol-3-phosphate acyltransferase [Bacteroidales bacterium]|nr:1-acyl-sn-glycerol-3-phosphate acyltransferase [Bacteroidales bacterium]